MSYHLNPETIQALSFMHLPSYREIPDVGLYLDQTSKIINQYLAIIPDSTITNSMISNYVKHGLLANPVKKQYYRDHIAYLISIAIFKNAISLDNIALLFRIQKENFALEDAYNFMIQQLQKQLLEQFKITPVASTTEDFDDNQQLLASIINVVVSKIYVDELFKSLKQPQ